MAYSWMLYVIMWSTWMMIVTLALRESRSEMGRCAALASVSEFNKSPGQNTDECWYYLLICDFSAYVVHLNVKYAVLINLFDTGV